jgi:trigger factor
VRSTVEALEGNKVKVVVEVEEAEFEKDLDAAFARLAKEVRLPGFRPGKAPRKVLEARIGQGYARDEAFREALPTYYSKAVIEHEVDVIAPPEIDITTGMENGPVVFDAVVEIRPSVTVDGYQDLEVEIPSFTVTDEDVDEAVDHLRSRFSELQTVDRPAANGDTVTIDIAVIHDDVEVPGMTTDDYSYEVGSGATGIPEMDEHLDGASAGDELDFEAAYPGDEDGEEPPLEFTISVREVQEKVLPEPTDEWVSENTEFDTLDELRADYRSKMERSRIMNAQATRRNKIAEAVAELVDADAVPEAMVDSEVENRIQDMAMRLQAQGLSFDQYLQFSGQDRDTMLGDIRDSAGTSARLDLALRAIAAHETIVVTDDEINEEIADAAQRFDRPAAELWAEFAEHGHLPSVRADLLKSKTLDWLIERIRVVDEDGQVVAADALELPEEEESADQPGDTVGDSAADSAEAPVDGRDSIQQDSAAVQNDDIPDDEHQDDAVLDEEE